MPQLGFLTRQDLRRMFHECGCTVHADHIRQAVDLFDLDHDGALSVIEFVLLMTTARSEGGDDNSVDYVSETCVRGVFQSVHMCSVFPFMRSALHGNHLTNVTSTWQWVKLCRP